MEEKMKKDQDMKQTKKSYKGNKFDLIKQMKIEIIKTKYLYPFNENNLKKVYQEMIDDSGSSRQQYSKEIGKQKYFDVLKSNLFRFPFSHVNVTTQGIKQLQFPLEMTFVDIQE